MTTALLIGGGRAGDAIARGLDGLSIATQRIDVDLDHRSSIPAPGLVVIPIADAFDGASVEFSELDDSQWQAACEIPLRRARLALQTAHHVLRGSGGRILFIVPTSAISGDAGAVASSAVAEGVRALGKSAALAWKAEGISVNFLAVTAGTLRNLELLRREVAPLVKLLAQCGPLVTGSTLVADGGVSMI